MRAKQPQTIQFIMRLPVKISKRRKWVVASCPILDVHAQGGTEKLAKKNLVEMLSLFFVSCFERGTFDSVLKGCGFKPFDFNAPVSQVPKKPSLRESIDVPIPFLIHDDPSQVGCHA